MNNSMQIAGVRIHAIVLTRERPETLRRCVATALSSLGEGDLLTVIDDSRPNSIPADSEMLKRTVKAARARGVHLSATRARELLARSLPEADLSWLKKTAARDIAPLRNLSLILSVGAPAMTTILIDDDIRAFDLTDTHRRVLSLGAVHGGVIVGANIGGINEHDTITRLDAALTRIDKQLVNPGCIRDLFNVESASASNSTNCKYVSAGYLALRLFPNQVFAFPPGYNEDWLWCLLHGENSQVAVLNSGHLVIHDPPSVLKPTTDDVLFELVGDLVFDCLEQRSNQGHLDPVSELRELSSHLPDHFSMPSYRASQLVARLGPSQNGRGRHSVLQEFGLSLISDMSRKGELDMNGTNVLTNWCHDAIQKHKAFARTLCKQEAFEAIQLLLKEGSL